MQFLLVAINAKYIHSNPAIYSLKAYANEELQEHIKLAEYTINNSLSEILADIYKRKPDAIGFSCYIWNITYILDLIKELHKLLPDVPIWLGGPEVTYDAENILQEYKMLTGIMIGEGEETFQQLLLHYVNGSVDLNNIPGICLHSGLTEQKELTDMNKLPFLYDRLEDFKNKIIYYESSRGCPFRCSYCLSSIDKTVRLRDINVVKKELAFFLENTVKQVKFVDRTFNCNHQHATEIWKYILENDNGITNFHFEISADLITEDELNILSKMRPGLIQLEIGVQSTNKSTLEAISRKMDLKRLTYIVSEINSYHNIHQHLDLIAGLPFENYESFANSFNEVYNMKPNQLQLGFLKVLKGSQMHEKAKQFGICYMEKPPYEVLYTNWLSYDEMLELKKIEEMVELYYNSNQFVYTMNYLQYQFNSPFSLYETLASFYEKKGYFINQPARAYRYQVLLEFVEEIDLENVAVYKELLTFDIYLREKVKSRPSFATELSDFKNNIREFYKEEELGRNYLPAYSNYDARQLSKMTHLEPFSYSVWEKDLSKFQKQIDKLQFVLFDYQERNPLTNEARTEII